MKIFNRKFTRMIFAGMIAGFGLLAVSCQKKPLVPHIPEKTVPVAFAGCRSSHYGIKPFPSNDEWIKHAKVIGSQFEGAKPAFVWIVGHIEGNGAQKSCILNFPLEKSIENATGFPLDENEEFLKMCDENDYQVWLQIEPGDADVVEIARQTMKRYKNHPSVQGFGVDVEWYKPSDTDGYGTEITDELAEEIDRAVKEADPRFNYFLKHWEADWMPPTYRSDIIFVNDSQQHGTLERMQKNFGEWAERFAPNTVVYQIGYEADLKIWKNLDNPVKEIGDLLAEGCAEDQNCGIIWVDFTLRQLLKKLK